MGSARATARQIGHPRPEAFVEPNTKICMPNTCINTNTNANAAVASSRARVSTRDKKTWCQTPCESNVSLELILVLILVLYEYWRRDTGVNALHPSHKNIEYWKLNTIYVNSRSILCIVHIFIRDASQRMKGGLCQGAVYWYMNVYMKP